MLSKCLRRVQARMEGEDVSLLERGARKHDMIDIVLTLIFAAGIIGGGIFMTVYTPRAFFDL